MKKALVVTALAAGLAAPAFADGVVKIGVLTDLSGPLSAYFGPDSVEAARMAAEDFGGTVNGATIEIVQADHQNKPDVGLTALRKWYDEDAVDAVAGIGNSAVALAAVDLTRERNKVALFTGASSTKLSQDSCSPNHVQWGHDVHMFAHGVTEGLLADGNMEWFMVVVDYTFGEAMDAEVSAIIEDAGGSVVGRVKHPLNNTDFSAYLLQAQASGASVIGLANSVKDLANSIKQAQEFGITENQKLTALAFTLPDIRALGLEAAKGTTYSVPFYWDQSPEAAAFSQRFLERTGKMPTGGQAGMYSAVTHYLKSVEAAGGEEDGAAVVLEMKNAPVEDFYGNGASVRVDGRLMKDVYLMQVKDPSESTGEWDLAKVVSTIGPDKAWAAASSACSLVQ